MPARDAVFLHSGDDSAPMQFGIVLVCGGPGLARADDFLDIDRLRAHVASRLDRFPRLRQRLKLPGGLSEPVWTDDPHFDLGYQIRHVALPRPGGEPALKALASSILEQRLDPARPLWEIWAVEGLDGDRFALIGKAHHSLLDGVAGLATLGGLLLDATPRDEVAPTRDWEPEPEPSPAGLLALELRERWKAPAGLWSGLRTAASTVARSPRRFAGNFAAVISTVLSPASETPLNGRVGPARRVDWLAVELEAIRRIREALGGTLNDVVMATVAGAARGYLTSRGLSPDGLDFRALIPIDAGGGPSAALGNHISALVARLPVGEPDPARRLAETRRLMAVAREQDQRHAFEVTHWLAEQTHSRLAGTLIQATMRLRMHNLMITNLPGPQLPLYVLEAPLLEVYPAAQLYPRQGLSVAVLSYHERLAWGFAANPELIEDYNGFVDHVRLAFRDLLKAAEAGGPAAA